MRYQVIRHHGGGILGVFETDRDAIEAAKMVAQTSGDRVDVYELSGDRLVCCYQNAMLWERDLVDLPGSERVRRYQAAALVGAV
jgi:hypothetical protein